MLILPPALAPLAAYRRFVTYDAFPDPDRPGKTIKRPTDVRTGHYCKVTDDKHHYSYDEAAATGRPVGFVFVEADGFFFFDLDNALEPAPGGGMQWNAQAQELCAQLAGAAVEVSQSGTGLHIIGRGIVPPHSCKNIPAYLELYTNERFCALTGVQTSGSAAADVTPAISAIAQRYFPPSAHSDIAGWTSEPVPEWDGPKTDEELLKAALASGKKSAAVAFGGGITFEDLWTANADVLGRKWPSSSGPFGASEADAALVSHLAYWTGKNCERIKDLMWKSGLVRQKWEDRPDYLDTTIMKATGVVSNVAKGRPIEPPPAPEVVAASGLALRDTATEFVNTAGQLDLFTGCVYIVGENRVWVPSTGALLDKARFDVVYGGRVFTMDATGAKTTDSAYDAFTRNRVYAPAQAEGLCFRPELEGGAIIIEGNRGLLNSYQPIETKRAPGDASIFTDHIGKLLPTLNDAQILFNYMAGVVQNPGLKAQWWPVLQGAEGNGKTVVDVIMAHCIGYRYSHLVNPDAMAKTGNQFNSWVMGNLYLGVEEIYVANRRDFLNTFKTTVTNKRTPLEGKGSNQATGDNRLNGVLYTNYKEAVPVSVDTRRYAIFYTHQQSRSDILRDGMNAAYFTRLYDWLYGVGDYAAYGADYGLAIVNDWLRNYKVDRQALLTHAPATSSTLSAYRLSLGRAEQEVLEAIEEGRPGFAGGWVSSLALGRLLDASRLNVPPNKRRGLMQEIGFDYHPHLLDGRVHNVTAPDNGKPRLYVREGHLAANLTDPAGIAKAYTAAQNGDVSGQAAARFGV